MPITINGTTGISGVDGSAATPALQGSDTNTGISFGADTVNINTGGTTRATVDSSGRVLVGTSSGTDANSGADNLIIGTSSTSTAGITINTGAGSYIGRINFGRGATNKDYGYLVCDHSNGFMGFGVASTERMRINSQGYLMVNSAGQGHHVAVAASAGTSTEIFIGAHTSTGLNGGTTSFKVWSNGNVVNTNNSYGSLSDAKLKENIVDANSQWNDLKAIQVRNYNFRGETGQPTHTQIGVIAQEIELVSPGLVSDSPDFDEEGNDLGTVTKSVNYSVLYMKAVKALQEAMERIESLETRLTALEGGTNP